MIAPPAGILCAGNLVHDILVRPVDREPFGGSLWVDSIDQGLGGNGSNTSYTLARLGARVRLLGYVGRDDFADRVLARLASAGVDLGAVRRSDLPTAASVVLVRSDGNRGFLHRPGASLEAFADAVDFSGGLAAGCSHFHVANIYSLPKMRVTAPETLRRARAAGLATSLDTGWDARDEWLGVLEPCLESVDLLFLNHDEAHRITGREDPAAAARFLQTRGARDVVIKLGARGCAVFVEGGEETIPGLAVQAVDTTGAGDCFVGGFLAALARGESAAGAARFANAVGALSVQSLGSVSGIRSFEETLAWMASQPPAARP